MELGLVVNILFICYFLNSKQFFRQNLKTLMFGVLTIQLISLGAVFFRGNITFVNIISRLITLFCIICLTLFESKKTTEIII